MLERVTMKWKVWPLLSGVRRYVHLTRFIEAEQEQSPVIIWQYATLHELRYLYSPFCVSWRRDYVRLVAPSPSLDFLITAVRGTSLPMDDSPPILTPSDQPIEDNILNPMLLSPTTGASCRTTFSMRKKANNNEYEDSPFPLRLLRGVRAFAVYLCPAFRTHAPTHGLLSSSRLSPFPR